MKGKLLIISYSFPPDNVPAAQRPYFMSKYLMQDGLLDTIVLAPKSALSSLGKSTWADISNLNIVYTNADKKLVSQTNSLSVPPSKKKQSKFASLMQFLSREFLIPDKGLHWFPQAWKHAKKIIQQDPDIKFIYSTSPSFVNHLVANKVRKKFNVRWVADLRDFYYTGNIQEKHFVFRKAFDRLIEKKIIRTADALTFISPGMQDEYKKQYPSISNKSYVIYNGFDEGEFNFSSSNISDTDKLIIFYGGSFYKGLRSPKPLIDILERLVNTGKVLVDKIEIRIAGNVPFEIFEEFKDYKVYRAIILLGLISRKDVINEMMQAHLLWLIVGNEKAHYLGFPVKGYEYIGARKHILAFTPEQSEPARIVNELKCGTVFGLEKKDEQVNDEKMLNLYEAFLQKKFSKSVFIEPSLLKKYTRQYQAHELFGILMTANKQ